jgi:hypothetical protein
MTAASPPRALIRPSKWPCRRMSLADIIVNFLGQRERLT